MRMLSLYKTDFLEVDNLYGIWKRHQFFPSAYASRQKT